MDVNRFLQQLLEELSQLSFVKNLDLNTEVFVIKGSIKEIITLLAKAWDVVTVKKFS